MTPALLPPGFDGVLAGIALAWCGVSLLLAGLWALGLGRPRTH